MPYGTCLAGLYGDSVIPSLQFNGSTQGLTMTDGDFGAYNRSKFALAVSFKLTSLSAVRPLFSKQSSSGATEFDLTVGTDGSLTFEVKKNPTGTGIDSNGLFRTAAATILVNTRYDIYAVFDYQNATAGDRIKIYSAGAALTAATSTTPASAAYDTDGNIYVGTNRGSAHFIGLMNQPALLSGSIPAYTSIYDEDGHLRRLDQFASLYSYLNARGGDVAEDGELSADWSASSALPTYTRVQP